MASLSVGILAAQPSPWTPGPSKGSARPQLRRNAFTLGAAPFSTQAQSDQPRVTVGATSYFVGTDEEQTNVMVVQPSLFWSKRSSDHRAFISPRKRSATLQSLVGPFEIAFYTPVSYPQAPPEVEPAVLPVAQGPSLGNLLQLRDLEPGTDNRKLVVSDDAADQFASEKGIAASVSKIGELCVFLIPSVSRVKISLEVDREDESVSLHFQVCTGSTNREVLDAEDRLHLAILNAVDVGEFPPFSIGYEFGG